MVSYAPLDSRLLYSGLVALMAVARLAELRIARRNTSRALAQGAVETGGRHYPLMVAMHAAFLVACALEVHLFGRPLVPALAVPALVLLAAAFSLRVWVIRTLDERWTTRIICFPGRPAIRSGPFRYLRHPNYLAVAVEIAALPLVHTAVVTAVVFSVLNGLLLRHRIRVEERALSEHCAYGEVFG